MGRQGDRSDGQTYRQPDTESNTGMIIYACFVSERLPFDNNGHQDHKGEDKYSNVAFKLKPVWEHLNTTVMYMFRNRLYTFFGLYSI